MSSPTDRPPWRVIVPVRGGPVGKSRLTSIEGRPLTDAERRELALAMAHDTVSAAIAGDRGPVVVLTGDDTVAELARAWGATVALDTGRGLNAELAAAAAAFAGSGAVCVLLGDLPALRPEDLDVAIDLAGSASRPGIVVPDWEGTGTTLVALTDGPPDLSVLGFGPGSAERHRLAGLSVAGLQLARLRCDVDTPQGWDRAVRLGLGASTAALRRHLLAPTR
ncbi:MAG: 2-phospho-L-lactate guanylyltransferase [Dermatophilaceae bacterium]|nr:2-phospho-L-lactate guanylyltransferase [Intrasporangiaceae bacterium]